jgi:hypothetical protein
VASVWLSRAQGVGRHHSGGTAPESTGFLFHETFGPTLDEHLREVAGRWGD